MVITTYFATAV
ncbi:hypothetical protein LINPERPRIM_LOCUS13332 [Linum perenne]